MVKYEVYKEKVEFSLYIGIAILLHQSHGVYVIAIFNHDNIHPFW
jgi:hypothetical protein